MTTVTEAPPNTASATSPPDEVADPRRFRALAIIALAQLMVILDASIVTIALPATQASLHISVANRAWVITAYTLGFGSLLLLGGRIADFMGRKRIFEIGLIGFAAASALAGLAENASMLFVARAVEGAFAGLLAPAALSLITVTFTDAKERARAFGVYGAVSGSAIAIGVIMGGILVQWGSWRWTMLVNVPIALMALAGSRRLVSESKAEGEAHYDPLGTAVVTAGLAALVYGFTRAESAGWTSGVTIAILAVAVFLLAVFVAIEARIKHPLLPLRILAERSRAAAYLAVVLMPAGLLGSFVLLTYYLQGILGYSAIKTGLAYVPYSIAMLVGSTLAGKLMTRIRPRPLLVGGMALGAIGLVLFAQVGVHTGFWSLVLPAEVVTALGLGLAFPPLTSTALAGVEPGDAGVASGLYNAGQQVGSSLGVALLNTIAATAAASYVASRGTSTVAQASGLVHGYTRYLWYRLSRRGGGDGRLGGVMGVMGVGRSACVRGSRHPPRWVRKRTSATRGMTWADEIPAPTGGESDHPDRGPGRPGALHDAGTWLSRFSFLPAVSPGPVRAVPGPPARAVTGAVSQPHTPRVCGQPVIHDVRRWWSCRPVLNRGVLAAHQRPDGQTPGRRQPIRCF